MSPSTEERKDHATRWFEALRDEICAAFEALEDALTEEIAETLPIAEALRGMPPGRFERKAWTRGEDGSKQGGPEQGGGVMSIMRGRLFEKVGVNVSTVLGEFPEGFAKPIQGAETDPPFRAGGLSLVPHTPSPQVPARPTHTRQIATTKSWFGGGADLTPMVPDEDDTAAFHAAFRAACDKHDPAYYPRFKKWCDEYFFLEHRGEPRGVGGIFYDYLDSGDWDADFAFTQDVGRAFLAAYPKIAARHIAEPWTEEQRRHRLVQGGRHGELHLAYDRGPVFAPKPDVKREPVQDVVPPAVAWP